MINGGSSTTFSLSSSAEALSSARPKKHVRQPMAAYQTARLTGARTRRSHQGRLVEARYRERIDCVIGEGEKVRLAFPDWRVSPMTNMTAPLHAGIINQD